MTILLFTAITITSIRIRKLIAIANDKSYHNNNNIVDEWWTMCMCVWACACALTRVCVCMCVWQFRENDIATYSIHLKWSTEGAADTFLASFDLGRLALPVSTIHLQQGSNAPLSSSSSSSSQPFLITSVLWASYSRWSTDSIFPLSCVLLCTSFELQASTFVPLQTYQCLLTYV